MKSLTTVNASHGLSMNAARSTPVQYSRAYIRFAVLAGCLCAALVLLLMSSGFGNTDFRLVNSGRIGVLRGLSAGKDNRSEVGWKSARMDTQSNSTWHSSVTRLPDKQGFKRLQLLDSKHVWIATNGGQLYKTEDSGGTWHHIAPQLPARSYLTSMSFVTPDTGHIALSKTTNAAGDNIDADATWIFKTNDGGKNWKQELAIDGAQIGDISFADQDDGWATGRRFGNVPPEQDSDLILHTLDGGRTWNDLSWNLPTPGKGVDERYAVRQDGASLVTLNGTIFNSDDTGRTWRQIGIFRDDFEQTAVQRIGSTRANRMWLLGGAASVEGTWSLLAQKPVDGEWSGYRLRDVYLSDAVYLADNSILACGFLDSRDRVSPSAGREGVVLYSTDGGQSWITAYRDSVTPSINSIAAADSSNIWAVGEGGLVLRLTTSEIAPTTSPQKALNAHRSNR